MNQHLSLISFFRCYPIQWDLLAVDRKKNHDMIPRDYPAKQWKNKKDDRLVLTLNTKERTFGLIQNDDDQYQSILDRIERRDGIAYTLCIEMFDSLYSLSLTHFECNRIKEN